MATNQENKSPFIEERDRRLKLISELGLWQEIREGVKNNGNPISERTAKDTFKVTKYRELRRSRLRVWLYSEKLLKNCEENFDQYGEK